MVQRGCAIVWRQDYVQLDDIPTGNVSQFRGSRNHIPDLDADGCAEKNSICSGAVVAERRVLQLYE